MNLTSTGESQTKTIAAALAKRCTPGDCIALEGDLGAGKTVFARGFIQALCGEEEVTSPTFTLMQNYRAQDGATLWHFDLYRIKSPEELEQLGMDEAIAGGISLVEWPEVAKTQLPDETLFVTLIHGSESTRRLKFNGEQRFWKERLTGLI